MQGLFEHASLSANEEVRIDRTEKEGVTGVISIFVGLQPRHQPSMETRELL